MRLTEKNYFNHLAEQIYFINKSCKDFDNGEKLEAKRIATHIRILVHDTANSTSLLTHLNCKNKLYYVNTAIPKTPFGLTGITTTSEDGGRREYFAPLGNLSDKRKEKPLVTFQNWWEEMKVLSDEKNTFSRKNLVLSVSNKDGGAHVDSKLNSSYADLTRGNSLNIYHQNNAGIDISVHGVELASIRQIAFELLKSLERKFPDLTN